MAENDRRQAKEEEALRDQLFGELERLVKAGRRSADLEKPWKYRSLIQQILVLLWRKVAAGDLDAPRHLSQLLSEAQDLTTSSLVTSPPLAEAAKEVHYLSRMLYVAESCLRPAVLEARLRDRSRSGVELAVLAVLLQNASDYLRRGEILNRLKVSPGQKKPDESRVSQILADLFQERLLLRLQRPARGHPLTSFYTLSRQGLELCKRLDLVEQGPLFEPVSRPWSSCVTRDVLAVPANPPKENRRVAAFCFTRAVEGSVALAHAAVILAREMQAMGSKILLLDLEPASSGLPDFLGIHSERGLWELIQAANQLSQVDRQGWLEDNAPSYCQSPRRAPDCLHYLPAIGSDSEEHDLLLAWLRSEVSPKAQDGAPPVQRTTDAFLCDFLGALKSSYEKILVYAPLALGPGSYLATLQLADEIFFVLRAGEEPSNRIRRILEHWVLRQPQLPQGGVAARTRFLITGSAPVGSSINLDLQRLLGVEGDRTSSPTYPVLHLDIPDDEVCARNVCESAESERWYADRGERLSPRARYGPLVELLRPNSVITAIEWRRMQEASYRTRHAPPEPPWGVRGLLQDIVAPVPDSHELADALTYLDAAEELEEAVVGAR